jgi:hypothetical protein
VVDTVARLSFEYHGCEQRLDEGVELASKLRGNDLDLSGDLKRIDALNVVHFMQK